MTVKDESSRKGLPGKKRTKSPEARRAKTELKADLKPELTTETRKTAQGLSVKYDIDVKDGVPNLGSEWIELFPHGISVSTAMGRPVLILKDSGAVEVLPVWMQPLDAGVALAELSQGSGATPHSVTRRLLEHFQLKLETCVFTEIVGHHQFVDLTFRGSQVVRLARVRADEAMSFCLQSKTKFYGTKPYMARCRNLDADLTTFEQNLNQGQLAELKGEIEISSKKNPYVI